MLQLRRAAEGGDFDEDDDAEALGEPWGRTWP